jgi:uncharacterized protein (TIGR02186 family)
MKPLLWLLMALVFTGAGKAETLVTQLNRSDVEIAADFRGQMLTLFGTIEPGPGETLVPTGPYHVVVTVTGPLQTRLARRKTNQFGIWINTDEARFESLPSFYQVLSDGKLEDIVSPAVAAEKGFALSAQLHQRAGGRSDVDYSGNLIRLMSDKGLYRADPAGVQFRSDLLFFAGLDLPSDAPPGSYIVKTYLLKDRALIAEHADGFSVRKIGFERFLGQAARQQPWLYGLAAVLLALGTGWLGGVVFRR